MKVLFFISIWILTSISAFAQTQEDYSALQGDYDFDRVGPMHVKVMIRSNIFTLDYEMTPPFRGNVPKRVLKNYRMTILSRVENEFAISFENLESYEKGVATLTLIHKPKLGLEWSSRTSILPIPLSKGFKVTTANNPLKPDVLSPFETDCIDFSGEYGRHPNGKPKSIISQIGCQGVKIYSPSVDTLDIYESANFIFDGLERSFDGKHWSSAKLTKNGIETEGGTNESGNRTVTSSGKMYFSKFPCGTNLNENSLVFEDKSKAKCTYLETFKDEVLQGIKKKFSVRLYQNDCGNSLPHEVCKSHDLYKNIITLNEGGSLSLPFYFHYKSPFDRNYVGNEFFSFNLSWKWLNKTNYKLEWYNDFHGECLGGPDLVRCTERLYQTHISTSPFTSSHEAVLEIEEVR